MNKKRTPTQEMTVGQLLAQVCRMSGHRLQGHMHKIGLNRGQGFALVHLWNNDGVTQTDLSRSMHISPASVTNMLQRMERDGWIERKRDETDQRVVRVYLTVKANDTRKQARRVFQEMEDALNSIYTAEEQSTLKQLLMKLHEYFAPGDSHPCHVRSFLQNEDADTESHDGVSVDTKNRGEVSADTESHRGESE
ncbi:MarR family transcriptional regulator [Candidatus Bipolaricaulota bacterium]|nr:MarR family transcriptional regulator [Candidatus Bipolaricaulota bacterium]